MTLRLLLAELRHRTGRALFLLGGYALGVAVMVVLLAVGEAMLRQSSEPALLGGGDVTVLPAGVSPEALRSGGAGSLFFAIRNARFIQREVLESPRAREEHGIVAASPLVENRLVEVSTRTGRWKGVAGGEIPSRARAVGGGPRLLRGAWRDSDADRRWVDPTHAELLREIDRFHLPTVRDSTWAEWHYFNVVLAPDRWLYLTFMVAGEVGVPGRWGGRVLLTVREADGTHRSLTRDVRDTEVRFDTASPDLSLGEAGSVALVGDRYRIRASVPGARVDLTLRPGGRYFPPADLGGAGLVSGYTAPALYATAEGTVCLPECRGVAGAQGYHDHNWGVWRGVSWEWGAASDERLSLLYGVVRGGNDERERLFATVLDERGVRALFRPSGLRVLRQQRVAVTGGSRMVPQRMEMEDARAGVHVTIDVDAVHATPSPTAGRRHFIQMRGRATVRERGRAIGTLPGFFETYVD